MDSQSQPKFSHCHVISEKNYKKNKEEYKKSYTVITLYAARDGTRIDPFSYHCLVKLESNNKEILVVEKQPHLLDQVSQQYGITVTRLDDMSELTEQMNGIHFSP